MVLDRVFKVAYACLSARTNSGIKRFCGKFGYK